MQVQPKPQFENQPEGVSTTGVSTNTPEKKHHLSWLEKLKGFIKEKSAFFTEVKDTIKDDTKELFGDLKKHKIGKLFGDAKENFGHFSLMMVDEAQKDCKNVESALTQYGPKLNSMLVKGIDASELALNVLGEVVPGASSATGFTKVALDKVGKLLKSEKPLEDTEEALKIMEILFGKIQALAGEDQTETPLDGTSGKKT